LNKDLAFFTEKRRLLFIKKMLQQTKMETDYHALGLEEARFRGKLVPHVSSVIFEDSRTKNLQMFSVGEAELAMQNCGQAWQGETSTISPLSVAERRQIVDTAKGWMLEDLSVVAFTCVRARKKGGERVRAGASERERRAGSASERAGASERDWLPLA
jgi:hypothetical protein